MTITVLTIHEQLHSQLLVCSKSSESIVLNKNNLAGTIPSALGKLTNLQDIDFGYNLLTGSLPLELRAIKSLKSFIIPDNNVNGTFFESFGAAWTELEILNLEGTSLTGEIPANVVKPWSTNLKDLNLINTGFNGTLPTEISALTQLTSLNVFGQTLGGQIPELSNLKNLGMYGVIISQPKFRILLRSLVNSKALT